MKKRILFQAILFLLLFVNNNVNAQCGATAVFADPQPAMICGGDTLIINFTSTGTCGGTYEYEVLEGAAIVQAWSTSATYDALPAVTTLFTVNARCSACPGTVVTVDFTVDVIEQPTITGDLFVCSGNTTTLTATGTNTMEWWDSQTGGVQVSPTEIFNTPALTADATYWVQVAGSVSTGGGSILITECGLDGAIGGTGSEDYIEISNLYTTPINTSGWVVAVSSSYTNINSSNATIWNLPTSFSPCSVVTRTDAAGSSDYWGNNIFWNSTSSSWAIIVDDVGNVVDFIAWGWTAAQLATFNPTINGFSITLGAEWTGNGCGLPCGSTGGVQYSFARTGSTDNNIAGDFICQPTSVNVVNPGLSCGWSASATCPYPATILVDQPPTASNPAAIAVECAADVPVADVTAVIDEADDYTSVPTVTFIGEVSDGLTCPETLTRTYRVADSCTNFIEVTQTITIQDLTAPLIDPAPADMAVECIAEVPVMAALNWTDNCDGAGILAGTEVSDGLTCPETITRTWTYTDGCGNVATETQVIVVFDITAPVIDPAAADAQVQCVGNIPAMAPLNWVDNCDGSGTLAGTEVSDGLTCPETITRTWTYTDGCGNTSTEVQIVIVNDVTPPTASNLPSEQHAVLPAPDPLLITDEADNCGLPTVAFVSDISDGELCPETVTRTYSVTDDCGNEIFVTQLFTVGDPFPDASFVASATDLTNLSTLVNFTNTTIGAVSYEWDFGDFSGISTEFSPSHLFPDEEAGGYIVQLIAYSPFGCMDTATVVISIKEELIYFIPNSFTPNGDEFNQTFQPVFVSGFDPFNFSMIIYNRWGETIFETMDAERGWDGTFNGKLVPDGIYTWKIILKRDDLDDREMFTGHVSIIR
ncbi:MAG: gliding motility-associated C-terminal domain-containing protein [Crocinitomicaceae bacterium]|nr:gliding motility-associated C-terminal domain-containing protein [Crocinitomicaceae bacterium]